MTRAVERGAAFKFDASATVSGRLVALARALATSSTTRSAMAGGAARVGLAQRENDAVVTVYDDRPGIAAERIALTFEPFVWGESSRKGETSGAGLGLSIAPTEVR